MLQKNLKVRVHDFGPISDATIELAPFTVFIGSNNSGKSFMAKLIQSILYSLFKMDTNLFPESDHIGNEIKLKKLSAKPDVDFSSEFEGIGQTFTQKFEISFCQTLEKAYLSKLPELARYGSEDSFIDLVSDKSKMRFDVREGKFINHNLPKIKVTRYPRKGDDPTYYDFIGDNLNIYFDEGSLTQNQRNLFFPGIRHSIVDHYRYMFYNSSYYFPAERHALVELQSFLAPLFYTDESPKVSELPLFFRELYIDILNSVSKTGEFSQLAEKMSTDLIEGQIVIDKNSGALLYHKNGLIIPLVSASTMVSQMSSLLMVLRGLVEKGDLLIIEEPEAHLHPANQLILAKYLVRLIRSGVKLLITTHSDLLVDQVGAYLVAQGLDEKTRVKKLKFEQDQFITQDEIAVYSFKANPDKKGYKVKKVKASQNDGIDAKEYAKVAEDIHDQYVDIRLAKNAKK